MSYRLFAFLCFVTLVVDGRALAGSLDTIHTYTPGDYSQIHTPCDILASYPGDPYGVAPGITRDAMDKPAALAACQAALQNDPDNPRLNYELARVLAYSGQEQEAAPYREQAIDAGYPMALFMIGYLRIEGYDQRPADPCYGGALVRLSALAGHPSGLVGFPHYVQTGRFDACRNPPHVEQAEILDFLDRAGKTTGDYDRRILIKTLKAHFASE